MKKELIPNLNNYKLKKELTLDTKKNRKLTETFYIEKQQKYKEKMKQELNGGRRKLRQQ